MEASHEHLNVCDNSRHLDSALPGNSDGRVPDQEGFRHSKRETRQGGLHGVYDDAL